MFVRGDVTTREWKGGGLLGETGAGVTHMYSFWAGIPDKPRKAVAAYVNGLPRFMGLTVVQHAYKGEGTMESYMCETLGFRKLKLERMLDVSMSGSGEHMRAYVFRRV